MTEVWKDIEGYEGIYQVSNLGRVRSLDRVLNRTDAPCLPLKGKLKHLTESTFGYYRVKLWKENKSKIYFVHRLVAQAFVPNPDNFPVVNHKDENKKNNRVDNLEWCTHYYNLNYGTAKARIKATRQIPVVMCDMDGNFQKLFNGIQEAADYVGTHRSNIRACINGRHKYIAGHTWKEYQK